MKSIRKYILWTLSFSFLLFTSVFILNSCSGHDGSLPPITGEAESGTVGVYATDRTSQMIQAIAVIERIEIVNIDTGANCSVLSVPTTINLADLTDVIQLVSMVECPSGAYNRIRIELDKSMELMSSSTGTASATPALCSLDSYRDRENMVHPLECSGPLCTLEIAGMIEVLPRGKSKLALDFDLNDLTIANLGDSSVCSIQIKVTAIQGDEIRSMSCPEWSAGLVSDLTVTNRTFSLSKGSVMVTVDYSAVREEEHPGLDSLLEFARNESLKTRVVCPDVCMMSGTMEARDVFVKVEGIVSNLDPVTRTLLVSNGSGTTAVDYSKAVVNGLLGDGSWALIRVYGNDGARYLASKMDLDGSGMAPDG